MKIIFHIALLIVALAPFWRGLFFSLEQLIFAMLILVVALPAYGRKIVPSSPAEWGMTILAAASLFSIIPAVNRYAAVAWAIQIVAVASVYCITSARADEGRAKRTAVVLACSAGWIAALGLGSYLGVLDFVPDSLLGGRLASTFQYPNTTGSFLNLALLLTFLAQVQSDGLLLRVGLAIPASLMSLAFIFTLSRGAFLVLPVTLTLFLILLPWQKKLHGLAMMLAGMVPALALARPMQVFISARQMQAVYALLVTLVVTSILLTIIAHYLLKGLRVYVVFQWRTAGRVLLALSLVLLVVGLAYWQPILHGVQEVSVRILPTNAAKRVADISLSTHSAWTRFMFIQTGARIAMAHPLLGVGGGGYASLYNTYQELPVIAKLAHSHPVQVWAETGIIGLIGYMLVWGGSTYQAIRCLFSRETVERKTWVGGLLVAAWAIGLHSIIDFDMSFLSIQLWVFTLLGLVNGLSMRRREGGLPMTSRLGAAISSGLTVIVAVAIACASMMAYAEWQASLGEQALEAGGHTTAITRLESAVRTSRINAKHYQQLALAYYQQAGIPENLAKARSALEQAVKHDSHNPEYHLFLLRVQLDQKDWYAGVDEATTLLELQAHTQANYEIAAETYAEGLVELVRRGEHEKARRLAAEIAAWPEQFAAGNKGLKVSKRISLAVGEAKFLLGEWNEAERYITAAEQNASWRPRIYWWLALIYDKSGNARAQEQLISKVPYIRLAHTSEDYQAFKAFR